MKNSNSFKYIILGGGNSAGYAAREFVVKGIKRGELCIITEEAHVAYERPALSKAYLFPENAVRLPAFHTTVGGGGERQTQDWYKEKGIVYKLNTQIIRADIKGKKLAAADGTEYTFEKLIIATGARPLTLKDFKMEGADNELLYYLRNVQDADRLIEGMKKAKGGAGGGKVVALGGGYIGMETAAALQMNGLKVTMVFPEPHLMPRLFTQKIADFYTKYYNNKGIEILYGKLASAIVGCEGECVSAVFTILDEVGEQHLKEIMLTYAILLLHVEPMTVPDLNTDCEEFLLTYFNQKVVFDLEETLPKLLKWGLVYRNDEDLLEAVSLQDAYDTLTSIWSMAFNLDGKIKYSDSQKSFTSVAAAAAEMRAGAGLEGGIGAAGVEPSQDSPRDHPNKKNISMIQYVIPSKFRRVTRSVSQTSLRVPDTEESEDTAMQFQREIQMQKQHPRWKVWKYRKRTTSNFG
eukprot:TRINITY_DN2010_c0_g1_i2.p1 TRINITY_DN2010_c0_g1~~TRINITY_DN2010_c0_g1_i2.p1  ORF type:complete len:496 (-),score=68.90 TRINITY_DN2010_c0_g1_i2:157-1548(-)